MNRDVKQAQFSSTLKYKWRLSRLQPCVDPEETGCFVRVNEDANQTIKEEFQAVATREARQPPAGESGRTAISRFFIRRQRHTQKRVITGTVTGSRFSDYLDKFDLRNLRSILNLGTVQNGQLRQKSGITTPEIAYGSYGSTIPLQTGHMGLYFVSYHHGGKPRVWHIIHIKRGNIARFEHVLRQSFGHDFVERGVNSCRNPLQRLQWIVSPYFVRRHKSKFSTIVQAAGNIVVILPRAYFMSFNCGFNMVESVQFATPRWVDIGKRIREKMCVCRPIWLKPDELNAAYTIVPAPPDPGTCDWQPQGGDRCGFTPSSRRNGEYALSGIRTGFASDGLQSTKRSSQDKR